MNFPFLHPYKIDPRKIDLPEAKSFGRKKHLFFPVPESDMQEAFKTFDPFPLELSSFYQEMGFGFLYRRKGKLNMLLDPMSLANMNLRLGYFNDDPSIAEVFQHFNNEKQLLFFKMHTGQYLSISRMEKQGENAVFYKKNN